MSALYSQTAEEYFRNGNIKMASQDYKGAITDYTKAIECNPKNAMAYIGRGTAKIELKDNEGGCLDFSKAGELGLAEAYEAIKLYCQ